MKGVFVALIGMLLILLTFGCTTQGQTDNNALLDNNNLVGGDKDSFGCIPSAGYSWCEAKQKCLRVWEENCSDVNSVIEHTCTVEEKSATMCTLEYMPVCGKSVLNTGVVAYATYGNKCGACSEMKVVSYTPGECVPSVPTNCTSWYDGCNTCFVTDGNIMGCTKMYCEVPQTPKCLEYKQDIPMDCVSWFDGCNNCGAKDGNLTMCTLMYCETPSEPYCREFASDINKIQIANPASTNCVDHNGTFSIVDTNEGQVGMCALPSGKVCEEWAYFRGECKE